MSNRLLYGQPGGRGPRRSRASPCPPPPDNAAAPTPPPRRRNSSARCNAIRAPDIPNGCPTAIAPPLTFILSGLSPSSPRRCDPHRRERLVDLHQIQILWVEAI